MPDLRDSVTAIIVNFRTPHLLKLAAETFCDSCPLVRVILVDNGSGDASLGVVEKLDKKYYTVRAMLLPENVYRGPATNVALETVTTPYFFLLDTDCVVRVGGFLELMLDCFEEGVYAVGEKRYVNHFGVKTRNGSGIPYVELWAALFSKDRCRELGEFVATGASGIGLATNAVRQSFTTVDFPIDAYIDHLGGGTRRMYAGEWKPWSTKPPLKWMPGRRVF